MKRILTPALGLAALMAVALGVAGCSGGTIVHQPVTGLTTTAGGGGAPGGGGGGGGANDSTVSGRVGDGTLLTFTPLQAQVDILTADGATVLGTAATDAQGSYSITVPAVQSPTTLIARATPANPNFRPIRRSFRFASPAQVDLFPSSAILKGVVHDSNGTPRSVDIWVMRETTPGQGDFAPYAINGGRDFMSPVSPSGMDFGWDSGPDGTFEIPIRVPNANFRLIFGVDRKTHMLTQTAVTVLGAADAVSQVPDPQMAVKSFTPVSFANEVQPIFTASCAITGCHTGAAPSQGMNLSSGQARANTVNVPSREVATMKRLEPGNAYVSFLYRKVADTSPPFGARMPLVGSVLTPTQLQTIQSWIEEGAQDS